MKSWEDLKLEKDLESLEKFGICPRCGNSGIVYDKNRMRDKVIRDLIVTGEEQGFQDFLQSLPSEICKFCLPHVLRRYGVVWVGQV